METRVRRSVQLPDLILVRRSATLSGTEVEPGTRPGSPEGIGQVRHQCSGFVADGNEPLCHLHCVLPSIRFGLSSLTCRSGINGTSVPNDYPLSTGKNSRRYRQD